MKKSLFLISLVNFYFLFSKDTLFKSIDLNYLLEPVICTLPGIQDFICKKYNHPEYKNFLGSCFIHIIDLLEYSKKNCPEPLFVKQVFDIFNQKIKEVTWVNPYALIYFLENTSNLIIDLTETTNQKDITDILAISLTEELNENLILLKENPQIFIEKYATKTAQILSENQEQKYCIINGYLDFVESLIDRVLFDFTEQTDAWNCFLQLAQLIDNLKKDSLIPFSSIYHKMMWALLSRFVYSLELNPCILNQNTFHTILNDLKSKKYDFLESEEIEDLLMKKSDWLLSRIEYSLKI